MPSPWDFLQSNVFFTHLWWCVCIFFCFFKENFIGKVLLLSLIFLSFGDILEEENIYNNVIRGIVRDFVRNFVRSFAIKNLFCEDEFVGFKDQPAQRP